MSCFPMKALSIRNQLAGTVRQIVRGPVVSEVIVETAAGLLASVITTIGAGPQIEEGRCGFRDGESDGGIDSEAGQMSIEYRARKRAH